MSNNQFGRLQFISEAGSKWTMKCECGTVIDRPRKAILRGKGKGLQSCGCLQREAAARIGRENNVRHGMKNTPTWGSWSSMRNRCQNPKNAAFHNYGGRGISVCDRWQVFENFLADMGERPSGTSIDRVDNQGNYEPKNCRWASVSAQARNRRTSRVIPTPVGDMLLCEAAQKFGIRRDTISYRLKAGWTVAKALGFE
jgi:hypothetical protein